MVGDEGLFQHFKPEERPFVQQLLDKVAQVRDYYSYHLTAFLNPREAFIADSLARRSGLQVFSSADLCQTEMVRLILAPDYYQLEPDDFELALLRLDYARKFHQLTHSQILGSLVNQLGIKRQLIGDILLDTEETQVLLDAKISLHVQNQVTKVARVPVSWQPLALSELLTAPAETAEVQLLVSSWRLDSLIAAAYRLSRQAASRLVESGKVKVNYQPVSQPAYQLSVSDLVSCRGYGRFSISAYQGETRQGKLKVVLSKIGGK